MASDLIGIEFTSASLRIALVEDHRILAWAVPLPQGLVCQGRIADPIPLAAILADTLKPQGIRCRRCALVLPQQHTLGLHLNRPALPDLSDCFREYMDGDSAPYDYDYVVTDPSMDTLYAVAVPRAITDAYAQVCQRAGLIPVLAVPAEMAWGNLIRLKSSLPETLAVADLEADIPGIRIFHRGHFVTRQELDIHAPSPADQIARAINLYNFTLPPEAPRLRELYYRGPDSQLPDSGSFHKHPAGKLLDIPSGDATLCAPAAGAALQGRLPRDAGAKQTMNLIRRSAGFDLRRVLPAAIAAGLGLLLFVQAGILGPLRQKALAYEELSQKQEQLAQIQSRLAGFDQLEQQYLRYGSGLMTESETALASRPAVLELVETVLAGKAALESLVVNQNILTISIRDVTLEEAGGIVAQLEANSLVSAASIQSATADTGSQARIQLTITLADNAGKEA